MRQLRVTAATALAAIASVAISGRASAAEIRAIVSGALTGAFRELAPQFERSSGNKVIISWGPSSGHSPDAIPVRIQKKEPFDVLIMVAPALDNLIKEGKFTPEYRLTFAEIQDWRGRKARCRET